MSFIAKNPLIAPEVESPPSAPQRGTRGLFAGKDGWYDIDSNNNVIKIALSTGSGGNGRSPYIGDNGNWFVWADDKGQYEDSHIQANGYPPEIRGGTWWVWLNFNVGYYDTEIPAEGADGGYYIPSVDTAGNLTWAPSKSGMPPVHYANIKGADGHSPLKGIDYYTDADKQEIVADVLDEIGEIPGGGNGSPAIIDVGELPTADINDTVFYRLITGNLIIDQIIQDHWSCYTVQTLPPTGEPVVLGDLSDTNNIIVRTYYNLSDGNLYGYVDDALSSVFGVPPNWYPASALMQAAGWSFAGIITDIYTDPRDGKFRLLLFYEIYSFKNGKWSSSQGIGWKGGGENSEAFNYQGNIASGAFSHAEGYNTIASGVNSHAEGSDTTASGEESHAEGLMTKAIGYYSHAEGYDTVASEQCAHAEGRATVASGFDSHAEGSSTIASRHCSHAEGLGTIANGDFSHAEGFSTIARGASQHAQGKYNIEDINDRYAHILGNGISNESRSNAHTIDWKGVGWFASGLKVGGTGQDDADAVDVMKKIDNIKTDVENSLKPIEIIGTSTGDKCAEFAGLFNDTDKIESFLFFTDPHLLNKNDGSESQMLEYLNTVKDCYDRTPTNFVVCGGDWIGANDTEAEACFKLSYSNKYCKSLFDNYFPVVGNHDINFNGGTGRGSAVISNETLRNVWQQKDKLYYAFDGNNTRFYVLDTQTADAEAGSDDAAKNRYFNNYRFEQLEWLRDMLVSEDKENSAIICHIMLAHESETINYYLNFAHRIMRFLELYNNRASGTYRIYQNDTDEANGISPLYELEYDFSQCTGTIRFTMCGHTHYDVILTQYSIPTICTTQLRDGNAPTFDLCLADYDNNVLHCVRVGTGENRTVNLPYVEKDTSVYLIHTNLADNTSQTNTKRITIVSSKPTPETGALLYEVDGTYPYYGFAVPEGATKITVTCPGYQWYLKDVIPSNYSSSLGYALVKNNSTWVDSGTTMEFYGEKKYFCLALRNNPEADFPADFDSSGISWTFE